MPEKLDPLPILVADDESMVLHLMGLWLTQEGYPVTLFNPKTDGLSVTEKPCRLLVTDLKMPGLDGLVLAGKIRAARPGLPFIVITGYPEEPELTRAKALGASAVVVKTTDSAGVRKRLLEAVREALQAAPPGNGKNARAVTLTPPAVTEYNENRVYLRHRFEEKKRRRPRFSLTALGRFLGYKSRGFLCEVLRLQKQLSEEGIARAMKKLSLKGMDGLFFFHLWRFNHAATPETRELHLALLRQMNPHFIPPPPPAES